MATKHIILGAGGTIGTVLSNELLQKNLNVKLVSRRSAFKKGAESIAADLTDQKSIMDAVEETSIVYLLAGLPYHTNTWQQLWPIVMRNTIDACIEKHARLVFFDNVYMYGKVDGVMTELTPPNPCSKKGEVRAQIAEMLLSEMSRNNLQAIIARAADFYGPYAENNSVPFLMVFDRLIKGKKPQWLANAHKKHSFTYTYDCGKALYSLATTESAYNQVWHLPTFSPAITGEEFIKIAAEKSGRNGDYMVLKPSMVRMAGVFDKTIREVYEMLYQNEYDYIFDSSKFIDAFHLQPTSYDRGIEETINFLLNR
jgi:nucleoside-diphosphate-sugar epimerase